MFVRILLVLEPLTTPPPLPREVNPWLTCRPCWQCNIIASFHVPMFLLLHTRHEMMDAMMNIVMSMMACVMGRHDLSLTSFIMPWVMAYMKHWTLWCVVLDTPLDYVEGGYIHKEDCVGFRLLIGFPTNLCIIWVLWLMKWQSPPWLSLMLCTVSIKGYVTNILVC